jgi:Xaa-Pro aminopeptidase
VLIDAGCEYQYYAGDITRTFPVSGHFSNEQRIIYELVLKAQLAGIEKLKPGFSNHACQEVAVQILTEGLVELGILTGEVHSLIEQKAYRRFYMHNFSHFIGLDGHEKVVYKTKNRECELHPGMVMSAEPGIYIHAGAEGVDSKWWGIGVRIEDTVLITENGNRILTCDIPKTIQEIEFLMQEKN